jgi:hypothetical protein
MALNQPGRAQTGAGRDVGVQGLLADGPWEAEVTAEAVALAREGC